MATLSYGNHGRESTLLGGWNDFLRKHPRLVAAFLTAFTVLVYAGALRNSFVYDDEQQILNNPFILNPHYWTKIFTGSVWSFISSTSADNFYRPLQMFYYWLVYRAVGANPGVFHFLQVLIYAGTALIVYRLGCEILEHECAALLGAGLWILHPLHVEPVAWIAGIPEVGAGFFFLLAFLLFVRAERSERPGIAPHLVAALVYFPALLFKEMALSFPLLPIAYWFFLSARPHPRSFQEWKRRFYRFSPYVLAVIAYIAIRMSVLGSLGRTRSLWKVSPGLFEAALALLGQHAHILVWPVGLSPFRTLNVASSLASPWPWIAVLVLIAVLWFRKQNAQLSFLLAWWGLTLLPCLDIRQLSVPQVADRFSYIPSVGPCLAAAMVLLIWLPTRIREDRLIPLVAPALALLMIFWATQTFFDIATWRDKQSLMKRSDLQSPEAPYPHIVKGDILRFQKGDLAGAEREYETALELNQKATVIGAQVVYESYLGLGGAAQQRGRDEQALNYYQRAAKVLPGLSSAYDFLGAYYFPRRDYATASGYFSSAVKANPQDVVAHIYLANCWMKLGRVREAVDEFHAARTVDPTLKQAYVAEAGALEALGDGAAAARVRASYH